MTYEQIKARYERVSDLRAELTQLAFVFDAAKDDEDDIRRILKRIINGDLAKAEQYMKIKLIAAMNRRGE